MGDVACHACAPPMAAERVSYRKAVLILAAAGVGVKAIACFVQRSVVVARRWIRRGTQTNDLNDRHRCGRPRVYSEEIHVKLVAFYCQVRPLAGTGRWTFRWAALHLAEHPQRVGAAPSKSTLHRVLRRNKLKPHQSRYFLHISDPEFFPKMEHLIALYKHPPRNLFFFDESPGIQILTRLALICGLRKQKKDSRNSSTFVMARWMSLLSSTMLTEVSMPNVRQNTRRRRSLEFLNDTYPSTPRRNRSTTLWTICRRTADILSVRWLLATAGWNALPKKSSRTRRNDVNGCNRKRNGSSSILPPSMVPG